MKLTRVLLGVAGLCLVQGCARPSAFVPPDLTVAQAVAIGEKPWVAVPEATWEHIVRYVTVTDQAMGIVEMGLRSVGRAIGLPGAPGAAETPGDQRGDADPGLLDAGAAGPDAAPGDGAAPAGTEAAP
jgi:hypothetical protein